MLIGCHFSSLEERLRVDATARDIPEAEARRLEIALDDIDDLSIRQRRLSVRVRLPASFQGSLRRGCQLSARVGHIVLHVASGGNCRPNRIGQHAGMAAIEAGIAKDDPLREYEIVMVGAIARAYRYTVWIGCRADIHYLADPDDAVAGGAGIRLNVVGS